MHFLKASPSKTTINILKPGKWFGWFLFVVIFFNMPTVFAMPSFQEFKNDAGSSSVNFKLMAIVDPENINLGDLFVLHVKMEISEGWHIYSLYAKGAVEESLATKITLHSDLFVPQGLWQEPTPNIIWDGALERAVKTHEQIVEFRRWYRLAESLSPGIHQTRGSIVFRACNNKICNLPREVFFNTEINVIGGES